MSKTITLPNNQELQFIPDSWEKTSQDYLNNPRDKNLNKVSEIQEVALEHGVDSYVASILYHSQKTKE